MKTLVILASVAALTMISITGRLHHDEPRSTQNELIIPVVTISTQEKQVIRNADSACQNTLTNYLASMKLTKNVFIIL